MTIRQPEKKSLPLVDVLHCKQQILGDPESFHPSPTYFGGIPCNAGLGGWHVGKGKGHGEREREMLGV